MSNNMEQEKEQETMKVTSTANTEESRSNVPIDQDEEDYEASARLVAEKVKRQQEGIESALLPDEYKDDDFKTVDEIQKLLQEQVADNASKKETNSELVKELGTWFTERSKYIPVRLDMPERKVLRLINNVLKGNDYTDVVDGKAFKNDMKRVHAQIGAIGAILNGLITANDYEKGQELVDTNEYSKYSRYFQKVFEIGRRYKVMNPEKLRGTYGKMVFMLQDSMGADMLDMLEFETVIPLQTVYSTLKKGGAEAALQSEWIATATMEILPYGKSRNQIQREIKMKEYAIDYIAKKYSTPKTSKETIRQCLYSIGDNSSFLNSNCRPVDLMITYLKQYFSPDNVEEGMSLAIYGGEDGSRLTHSHERQYHYVLQSLTLWREIVHDMFRLWYLAEEDLLDKDIQYKLRETGQGRHRVQDSPRTSRAMHGILYAVQQRLGHTVEGWVGSSVIHLGDSNVPNSLVFIDKYNQVSRILNPIVQCLQQIDEYVAKDPGLNSYLAAAFGGAEETKKAILVDFFRGAFDGSGADNFFEAGSCIDGRLTSAWNWCQSLSSKSFYRVFLLTNFMGFDGDFQT